MVKIVKFLAEEKNLVEIARAAIKSQLESLGILLGELPQKMCLVKRGLLNPPLPAMAPWPTLLLGELAQVWGW